MLKGENNCRIRYLVKDVPKENHPFENNNYSHRGVPFPCSAHGFCRVSNKLSQIHQIMKNDKFVGSFFSLNNYFL